VSALSSQGALRIELAERADVASALAFSNWAAEHTVANFALVPEQASDWEADFDAHHAMYPWLVARSAKGVVGFAKGGPFKSRGAYAPSAEVTVYVDPAHHRRGVGRALYEVLIPLLRAQGYATLLAGITTPHPASERLHEAFGFKRCAVFAKVGWKHGDWHDVSFYELRLQAGDGPPAARSPVRAVWGRVRGSITGS
jgi:L-amino acid N-acyltransferase YncA